jgi:hypothetical protein
MGDGEDAQSDGNRSRMMRPNWEKACYRWSAGHMLLKEYKQLWDALMDAQKLDPGSVEIEKEQRYHLLFLLSMFSKHNHGCAWNMC